MLSISEDSVLVAGDEDLATKFEIIAPAPLQNTRLKIVITKENQDPPPTWVSLAEILTRHSDISSLSPAPADFDATVLISLTSGTTSTPKACPHNSQTLCLPSLAYRKLRHIDPEKRSVQHLSSNHAFGITVMLAFWFSGASVVYPNKTFEASSTLDAIESQGCSHMAAVPSMIYAL